MTRLQVNHIHRRDDSDSNETSATDEWLNSEGGPASTGATGSLLSQPGAPTIIHKYETKLSDDGPPVTITETVYVDYSPIDGPTVSYQPHVTSVDASFTPSPTAMAPPSTTSSNGNGGTPPPETNTTSTGKSDEATTEKGVSPGASAGIAIGCIVAGLVIGFIAAFFLRRKKKQEAPVAYVATAGEPKMYNAMPVSATPPPDSLQLNQFLPLATPDKELASELHSIGDLIQAHVENNYHLQPTSASPQMLAQALSNLGVGAHDGSFAGELVSLAMEPRTRQPAIQHVLANVLFTSIDFSAKSRLTMLPAPVAAFLQSVPPTEKVGGNEDATKSALSRWRMLSAFLLNPTRSLRNTLSPSENAIAPQASGLVNALNTFLDPFIPNNLKQQQADHLQAVVIECAKFGYTIFSQPSDWKFNLSSSQPGYRMAVVCAGLDKLTTNEGQPYSMPNSVAAPTLVQV